MDVLLIPAMPNKRVRRFLPTSCTGTTLAIQRRKSFRSGSVRCNSNYTMCVENSHAARNGQRQLSIGEPHLAGPLLLYRKTQSSILALRLQGRARLASEMGRTQVRDHAFNWASLPATILGVRRREGLFRTAFPGRCGLQFRREFSERPVRQRLSIHRDGKRGGMRRDIQGGRGSAPFFR